MQKLLDIAKKILAANPGAYLSGSLALKLQGFPNPNEPEDIDIWIPGHVRSIEGMHPYSSSDRYEEKSHARESFMYDGVQIDFFFPIENPDWTPITTFTNDIHILHAEEILKFKIEHIMDTEYMTGVRKHAADLMYIIQNHLKNTKDFKDSNRFNDELNIITPLDLEF